MKTKGMSYTYVVTHKDTGLKYIGAHTICGERQPLEDLGFYYFTSSKLIKMLIEKGSSTEFSWEVLSVFSSRKEAFIAEDALLRKIPKEFQKQYFNKIFASNGQVKLSLMNFSGIKNHNYGRDWANWSGRKHSLSSLKKISQRRVEYWEKIQKTFSKEEYKSWCMRFACLKDNNGMFGRERSEEEKVKIRNTRKLNMLKGNGISWQGWYLLYDLKCACISREVLASFLKKGNLPRNLGDYKLKNGSKAPGLLSKGFFPREKAPSKDFLLINNQSDIETYWEKNNGITTV